MLPAAHPYDLVPAWYPCAAPQQRLVGDTVLLEAALENATREAMLLDTITFLPAPAYTAERIAGGPGGGGGGGSGLAEFVDGDGDGPLG